MNRLKQLRTERNLKQRDIARLLGIEISAVSKLEIGRVPLKDEYIVKLANFFNVTTDYLLGRTDSKNNTKSNIDADFYDIYETYQEIDDEDKEVLKAMFEAIKKKRKK